MNEQRLDELFEAIENNPEDLSLYIECKDLAVKLGLYEESEEIFELMIDLVNTILAMALEDTGQIPTLSNGEQPYPYLAQTYFEWGKLIKTHEAENYEKQLQAFTSALEFKEDFKAVYPYLASVYKGLAQYSDWLSVMEKINASESNNRVKIQNLYKMKEVAEHIGETDNVIAYYKELIDLDRPKVKENISNLENLLESLDEWNELADLYENLLEGRITPKEKKYYNEKLIEIYKDKVQNKDKVFRSLSKNFKKNPKDKKLKEQLEEVAASSGMQEELLSFYENIVESIMDSRVKKEIYLKIADILFTDLGEVSEAKDIYEKILSISANEVEALERMVEILNDEDDSEERTKNLIDLNNKLAKHYLIKEKNEEKAIDYYYNVLNVDPKNVIAFKALEKTFKMKKMLPELSDLLKLKVEHLESGREKAQTSFMLGELLYKHLSEKMEAAKYFKISFQEGETRALKYIETIAKEEDNFEVILEYKLASIETLRSPKQKADTYKEVGELYQDKLFEPEKAVECFVKSVKLNPKDKTLAVKVIEFVYESGSYEVVADALKELDRAITMLKSFELYSKLGEIAYNLEKKDLAAGFYKKATDINKNDFDAVWKLALLYEEINDNSKALRTFQFILTKFKSLEDDVKYELYLHAGKAATALKDRKARKFYEAAFNIERTNVEALTEYYKLLESENSFKEAINVRLEVVDLTSDTTEHINLYTEIAEIYKKRLNDKENSLLYYNKIFKLGANDKDQLLSLLDRYNASKNYKGSVDVLNRLISMEKNSDKKIDLKFELLNIYETKLQNLKQTLKIYQDLYKELPDDNEVVAGYEAILKKTNQWKDIVALYATRLPKAKDPEKKKKIWMDIANIYAGKLGDVKQAITALEQVLKISPKDNRIRGVLSSLYAKEGGDPKKQIKLLRKNIKAHPFDVKNYEQLFNVYLKQKKLDKAYVVARILRYFKKIDQNHKALLKKFKGKGKLNFNVPLSDYQWKLVFHHRVDNQITDIFNAISVPMAQLYSTSLKNEMLTSKELLDLNKTRNLFSAIYGQTSMFLNLPTPPVYLKQGARGFSFINTGNISVKIGYDIFNSEKDKDLLYHIGKSMTYRRPEFILAQVIPGKVIKNIFLGVLNYVMPDMNIGGDINQLNAIKNHLEKYTAPETLAGIQDVVNAFIKSKGSIDLNKWLNAVEFTSNRVAFLLTQDLSLLDQMFRREVAGKLSKADYKLKMGDILNYSVSDNYFKLRKEIGLSVK